MNYFTFRPNLSSSHFFHLCSHCATTLCLMLTDCTELIIIFPSCFMKNCTSEMNLKSVEWVSLVSVGMYSLLLIPLEIKTFSDHVLATHSDYSQSQVRIHAVFVIFTVDQHLNLLLSAVKKTASRLTVIVFCGPGNTANQ